MSVLRDVQSVYSEQQVRRYLRRISWPGFQEEDEPQASLPPATIGTLALLMFLHLTHIPFENTALHFEHRRYISIDPQETYKRFVEEGYGGYCMNHNTLLLHVLRLLGFKCWSAGARVYGAGRSADGSPQPGGITHMVLFVRLPSRRKHGETFPPDTPADATYLVDCGFGGANPLRPIEMFDGSAEYGRADAAHRVVPGALPHSSFEGTQDAIPGRTDEFYHEAVQQQRVWLLQHQSHLDASWDTLYAFSPQEMHQADFEAVNAYTAGSEESIFRRQLMLSLMRYEGAEPRPPPSNADPLYPYPPASIAQVTMTSTKLKIKHGRPDPGQRADEREITSEEQRVDILRQEYGLCKDREQALHLVKSSPIHFR